MLTVTILDKLRKAEVDMGILAGPVNDSDFLEIPLYHEQFLAYVSPKNQAFAQERLQSASLLIRKDYIHEAKINAVVDTVRQIIPGRLLERV